MARYINRKDLDFLNDFRIDSGKYAGLRLDDIFDELVTADAVEHSEYEILKKENHELATKYDNAMNRVAELQEEVATAQQAVRHLIFMNNESAIKLENAIEEIKQEIINGTIKIVGGNEKLFSILENAGE